MRASEGSVRIPSLDGLRAMSIALVVLGHLAGTSGVPSPFPRVEEGLQLFGVRVFFVISGFLITSLLLDEAARHGTISLTHFYFRRTMRIFPPFYVYVAAVATASALGFIQLRKFDALAAVTYTTNYHHKRSWYLGHAWSLAVEEQFYLLWPFLMKYLGPRRAALAALTTVVASPLLRFALLLGAPSFRAGLGETFPTVADYIATGCLLSCYRGHLDTSPRFLAFLRSKLFWIAPALALVGAIPTSAKFDNLVGHTLTNLGAALLIERAVRFPRAPFGRVLNARPVAFVGVLSYSLYLWQQPFLNRHSNALVCAFPLNLTLAVGMALLSHYLVERPALRLRARLRVATPMRAQEATFASQP